MELVYIGGQVVGDVDRAAEGCAGWFASWYDADGYIAGESYHTTKRLAIAEVKREWCEARERDEERARKNRTIRPFTYQGVRYFPTHNKPNAGRWAEWSAELVDGSGCRVHGQVWARGITRRRVIDALADWVNFRLLRSA